MTPLANDAVAVGGAELIAAVDGAAVLGLALGLVLGAVLVAEGAAVVLLDDEPQADSNVADTATVTTTDRTTVTAATAPPADPLTARRLTP